MKTLKGSILNRSSHTGEGFKAQRRGLIEEWLDKYNIKNYTINDDFTIDVDDDVDLEGEGLVELPNYIQFGVVKKDFNCRRNELTSLKGSPKKVERGFYCSNNNLTSLQGCSRKVRDTFDCSYNQLTSLEGAPEEVEGGFYCTHNQTQFTGDDVRKVCNVKRLILC